MESETVTTVKVPVRTSRAAKVGLPVLAGGLLFVGGWVEGIPRVEDDLTGRVDAWLVGEGYEGVTSSFSGQDGTLHCTTPIDAPHANYATNEGAKRWGVRTLEWADGCVTGDGSATEPTLPADTTAAADTSVAPDTTALPETSVAPDTSLAPAVEPVVVALFERGTYTLRGTVADELQRNQLLLSAAAVVSPENVVDELVVAADAGVSAETSDALAALIRATPPNLVRGESGWNGTTLYSQGVFRGEAERAAFEAVAADVGVEPQLEARPEGEACDTQALAEALNAEVAEQAVQFDSGRATITAESAALLDRIAGVAEECGGGITITVTGHTDSSGSDAENQRLSEQRAAAVVAALVDRGLPADSLVAVGKGETELILVDGVEDKAASRRVEFTVAVA